MSTLYERSRTHKDWASIFDHPERVANRVVEVDGYTTAFLESGDRNSVPLVLIHGGNFQVGAASDRWYPTILPLSKHFHVITVDELGGGGTDAPKNLLDIGDVTVRAEHVLQFLDRVALGPAHLVGQSQGAWIAAYIALKRPDLVKKLVLVDSASLALPGGGMGGPNIAKNFADSFIPGTMVNDSLSPTPESVRSYFATMVYDQSMLCDPLVERLVVLARKWLPIWDAPWREFWADGGERNRRQYLLDGVHLAEHMPRLSQRPLIIWGNNSVKGIDNGLALFKRIPDSQFHVFDKANHFLWLDRWREFNSLVTWFLLDSD